MKLNLGCGSQTLEGWRNVDKHAPADQQWDLEDLPWPWGDDSAEAVLLSHVLEHLGQQPAVFIGIMKELYRVCRDGAEVRILAPHPRHDSYLIDPTHVRPILPATLEMFSRSVNLEWQRIGAANTPLALHHDVDFETVSVRSQLDEPYRSMFRDGRIKAEDLQQLERSQNNVVVEFEIVLRVRKGAGG